MADIIDTDESAVFMALVALLRSRLQLDENHCFEQAEPLQGFGRPPSGDYWLTVSPGDGDFANGEFQAGGGAEQVTEFNEATLIGYTRIRLDSTDRDTMLLHDLQRGLLPIKKRLLWAVCGKQLVDASGNELLRSLIYAKRGVKANYDKQETIGWIGIVIGLDYDWDLSNAPD